MSRKQSDQIEMAANTKMASLLDMRNAQRAEGRATILAIGTANPPNEMNQADFPDFYFRVTKADHMTDLKDKFKHMCKKSTIKKRYMYLTEEFLKESPHMCDYNASSLDTRQDILATEVPKLGKEAAVKAIGAVIVGADPDESINERPIFELAWAAKTFIPDSERAIAGQLRQVGLTIHLSKDVPKIISNNIEKALVEAFKLLAINDWNSIFWVVHPGGPAILDEVEAKLGLKEDKLGATRHVLSEYGNMSSASVLFILDETRKRSFNEGKATTGNGLDWGVLFGFGPGITIETVVLHSVPIKLD